MGKTAHTLEQAVQGRASGDPIKWTTRPSGQFTKRHKGEITNVEHLKHGSRFTVLDHNTFQTLHVITNSAR